MLPQAAWRLDNRPDLLTGEARIDLEHLVLDAAAFDAWRRAADGDPGRMRAALLETCAERGKVCHPQTATGGMFVGRLAETGPQRRQPQLAIGTQVASLGPLTATPVWLASVSDWDGSGRVVPCRGHAIVAGATPIVALPDGVPAPVVAAALPAGRIVAALERAQPAGQRVAIIGGHTVEGHLAAVCARELGAANVVAVVTTLHDARLCDHVGAAEPTIVAPTDAVDCAGAVEAALGGPADVTVVAMPGAGLTGAAVLGTREGGRVLAASDATVLAALGESADALGRSLEVIAPVGHGLRAGAAVADLLSEHLPLARTVAWAAGLGPDPLGGA